MARVLVTGASGFIGSQLAARLVDGGDDVTCLVRPTSKLAAIAPLDVRLARGEVVVVEDCFAVRIKEIVPSRKHG